MQFIKDLFSDDSGASMMRVMALISLLVGAYLAIIGKDSSVAIFVTSAFSAKLIQKHIETRKK